MFSDKKLICKDCAKEFVWTAGEQRFFSNKGFTNPPIRCSDCRKKKKEKYQASSPQTVNTEKFYKIKCKKCGVETEVPFEPKFPNDILCAKCFSLEHKS